jgi:hypothetical protein
MTRATGNSGSCCSPCTNTSTADRPAAPDRAWPIVEPAGESQPPILELPLREQSVAATFRAVGQRRRVVNGASGHDPPHWELLADALERRDPEIMFALATLGPIDVVVERSTRPDSWEAFVSNRRYQARGASPAIHSARPTDWPPPPISRRGSGRSVAQRRARRVGRFHDGAGVPRGGRPSERRSGPDRLHGWPRRGTSGYGSSRIIPTGGSWRRCRCTRRCVSAGRPAAAAPESAEPDQLNQSAGTRGCERGV